MKYRKFGKHDFEVSLLGFGAMRLPIIGKDESKIDEDKAIEMIRYAIDHGVNYVDTAYPYHHGNSEYLVGKALKDGYREKVKLATKNPVWLVEKHEDFERYLDEQLKKLDVDHVDMYLLHALIKDRWEKIKSLNVFKFLEDAVAKGKVKYVGFSFHDERPVFMDIVDSYNWDFCQIQLNYRDVNYQAGVEGLKHAASKGLAVVIMEPLKGGKLARVPRKVQEIFNASGKNWSPVEWSFRWLANFPEVTTILSGMSTLEQVKENVEIMSRLEPNSLTDEEIKVIEQVQRAFDSLAVIDCTGCGYCMPCPNGVDIPRNFAIYNEAFMYEDLEGSRRVYNIFFPEENRANKCVQCGECEPKCPQGLPIIELLKRVDKELSWQNA